MAKLKIVDLQIRIARKMASGKAAIQLAQADLDILVQSGAYAALCDAATAELKMHRSKSANADNGALHVLPTSLRGFEMPDAVATELARAKASFKQPARPRSTAPILPALIKSSVRT